MRCTLLHGGLYLIKCAAHYYTVDFTRLLVSANTNTDNNELAFIQRSFYVADTQMRFTILYGGLYLTACECKYQH